MNYSIKILTILILALCLAISVAGQGNGISPLFESQELKFDGLNLKLAGTLTWPKTAAGKRAPAIMILTGSGISEWKDVPAGTARPSIYRDLAEAFAARGFASFRYDRRCAGASECKKAESYDDYIDDAKGALEFLRKHEKIDSKRIFVFGHSEGGVIAASLGSNDEQGLAGVVLASAAGRNLTKLMREQFPKRMRAEGRKSEEIAALMAKFERIARGLTSGQVHFPGERFNEKDPYDAMLGRLIDEYAVVVSLLINDPLQIAATIKFPVLIVQGRKDDFIPVIDATYLEEALKRVNHPDTTLHLFDEIDHSMKSSSIADGPRLDTAMLSVLTGWMEKKIK